MKIHFLKELPVPLFALASASTLVSLTQVESAWTGMKEVYSRQDFGLRILREAMLVGLASQQGAQDHFGMDGRIAGNGKLVWLTSESSLSVCCASHGRDGRQGIDIK